MSQLLVVSFELLFKFPFLSHEVYFRSKLQAFGINMAAAAASVINTGAGGGMDADTRG
jgi:hypothetical protein